MKYRSNWLRSQGFKIFLCCLCIASVFLYKNIINRNLILAVDTGSISDARWALHWGADPNTCIDGRSYFMDKAGYTPVLLQSIMNTNKNPLRERVPMSEEMVRLLLEAGADVHLKGSDLLEEYDATSYVNSSQGSDLPPSVVQVVNEYAKRK